MPLGERKKIILKAVVDDYIKNAEPVGSKALASKINLKLSSATLRNEMAELESMGYLEQPHTSAGRIPSNLGYRLYVDELMKAPKLSAKEIEVINSALKVRLMEIDRLIAEVGRAISRLTSYTSYAAAAMPSGARIRHIDILPIDRDTCVLVVVFSTNTVKNTVTKKPGEISDEKLHVIAAVMNTRLENAIPSVITTTLAIDIAAETGAPIAFVGFILDFVREEAEHLDERRIYVDGAAHLLAQPEYKDVEKAQRMLEYFSNKEAIAKLPEPDETGPMKILIGNENLSEELKDSSVVVASYDIGDGMKGLIGLVGPTRMDYSKAAAHLEYFTRRLGKLLGSGGKPEE